MYRHADLTRTDFTEHTTVLMRDSSGVVALFGHASLVDEEDAIVGISERATRRSC